jgi:hypothetical protein
MALKATEFLYIQSEKCFLIMSQIPGIYLILKIFYIR